MGETEKETRGQEEVRFDPQGGVRRMEEVCREYVLEVIKEREPLFGSWTVDRFVGPGGFSCVFTMSNRNRPDLPQVILKVIPVTREVIGRYKTNATMSRALFHAEQEIARYIELAHLPNLVNLHNFQILREIGPKKEDAFLLLVMDYYPRSLTDVLKEDVLSPGGVIRLLAGCLSGLESIHGQGVAHRDIKPDNIFMDDKGDAHIGDFGIAVSLENTFGAPNKAGTLLYMPPEACVEGKLNIGDAMGLDLYALGVVGYKALEGVVPFERESQYPKEILVRRVRGDEMVFQREVPAELQDVLRKALAHEPGHRFATAAEFKAALLDAAKAMEKGCPETVKILDAEQAGPAGRVGAFLLAEETSRGIKRELAKADRCGVTMALVLARVEGGPEVGSEKGLEQAALALEDSLRLSDTVVVVDSERVLAMGLATTGEHADLLMYKVAEGLEQALGKGASVTAGYSVFPADGKEVEALLQQAETSRRDRSLARVSQRRVAGRKRNGEAEQSRYSLQVLKNAFGRQFQNLVMSLDARTLHALLAKLDSAEQWAVLSRINHAMPLARELAGLLRKGASPARGAERVVAQCLEPGLFRRELEVRRGMKQEVLSRLENAKSLPTLPEVALRIFELASNPDVSVEEVSKLVSRDPSLLSKVLQIVNSPFYGLPSKVVDINRAVVLLGVNDVMDISLGLAAASTMKNIAVSGAYNPKYIWHHSYVTGLIAVNMCKGLSPEKQSWIFTIALLHDIGKIFFAEHFPEAFKNVAANSVRFDIPSHELEMETFGICHATVGRLMALKWNLPDQVAQGIARHHAPSSETGGHGVSAIIGFADYLYNLCINEVEGMNDMPHKPAVLTLGQWKSLSYYMKNLNDEAIKGMKAFASRAISENSLLLDVF